MTDSPSRQFGLPDYADDYATCAATYATFRIYTGSIGPESITGVLEINPTKSQWKGRDGAHFNGWFLSSKDHIDSRDVRRHVDWLLEKIGNKRRELLVLQSQAGIWMDVACYWRSVQGHGGPALNPTQMQMLADLNLQIGFDCY